MCTPHDAHTQTARRVLLGVLGVLARPATRASAVAASNSQPAPYLACLLAPPRAYPPASNRQPAPCRRSLQPPPSSCALHSEFDFVVLLADRTGGALSAVAASNRQPAPCVEVLVVRTGGALSAGVQPPASPCRRSLQPLLLRPAQRKRLRRAAGSSNRRSLIRRRPTASQPVPPVPATSALLFLQCPAQPI